jgi:hypothetical protein
MHQPGIEPGSHRWQRCILPQTTDADAEFERTNLSPFTKGCRESDASVWLHQFLGSLDSNQYYVSFFSHIELNVLVLFLFLTLRPLARSEFQVIHLRLQQLFIQLLRQWCKPQFAQTCCWKQLLRRNKTRGMLWSTLLRLMVLVCKKSSITVGGQLKMQPTPRAPSSLMLAPFFVW